MADWSDTAIILSSRPYGEGSVLLNLFSENNGRRAGLVRGGQSGPMKGTLQCGNIVKATWRARLEEHLGNFTIELMEARTAAILNDPLCLTAITSICAIIEGCLSEREPHQSAYHATEALIAMITNDNPDDHTETWLAAYIRWEVEMIRLAGYGLDLSRCVVTGEKENLAYVSPRTGATVTSEGAGKHVTKLLPLPSFLGGSEQKNLAEEILDGMALTQHFLKQQVFGLHHAPLPHARERLEILTRSWLIGDKNEV